MVQHSFESGQEKALLITAMYHVTCVCVFGGGWGFGRSISQYSLVASVLNF